MSSLEIGRKLAHYEILARIGEGGMGEVYRARDLNLGREVALKVLPPNVASHPSRQLRRDPRFVQEVRRDGRFVQFLEKYGWLDA